jgi:hypothetical protein
MRVSADTNRLNPGHALELITLRELKELDRATSPLKYEKYFRVLVLIIATLVYIVPNLYSLKLLLHTHYSSQIIGFLVGISPSIIVGSIIYRKKTSKLKKDLDERYDAQIANFVDPDPEAQKSVASTHQL